MSVIHPNEVGNDWRTHRREATVHLYLNEAHGDAAALIGSTIAGFPIALRLLSESDQIDAEDLATAAAAIIQVEQDSPDSVRRFQRLAAATSTPLIAAAYEPPLALVRALIRAGARDVVPLPLELSDLETSLAPVRDALAQRDQSAVTGQKVVSFIKSLGGVGATSLVTQLGIRFAQKEALAGRDACLIDLDVQFGDVAFQLGLRPTLSLADLIGAGGRLDGDLVRATTTTHSSGLKVIASPPSMMPLDALSSEQAIEIVNLAKQEFGTVFLDLPTNWTNWSLSLLAQSDLVLLISELTVASLHRARRQLELIASQELSGLDLRLVINRFEKGLLRTVRASDVRDALGRDISFTIANDHALMSSAVSQGVPITEVKRKSALGKDVDVLDAGIARALGLER